MGILDDYFDGYYSEEMIESQVIVVLLFDCELVPNLISKYWFLNQIYVKLCFARLTNLFLRSWCARDFLNWVCFMLYY